MTVTSDSTRPVALVTGAGKGIGAAIAVALAEAGYDLWINYRSDHAAAEKTADAVRSAGADCLLLPFDVSCSEAVTAALDPLLEKTIPLALVNNAGFARDGLMMWMSEADWSDVLSVHLGGFFHVTKCVMPLMLRQRQGYIVNVASTSGQTGVPGQTNYSAAKAGLIGATRSLAKEVARRNILVNAVAPGFIDTEMTQDIPIKDLKSLIPLGRMGKAAEVASMVRFLCSEEASYITGQVFSVNGGVYM
ncbi:3-oxoacyl-(acyl carrier protein) reductase [Syntrophotalea carbinolica DSM 2380]|uniref:3-oxoacyl-(Acyl carrier protein) reductase n=1 Tax=Syntrophotalea carbinolica (strain DSM 2380 / NBRC 103641 / GraBd1) TaxID=338963 RepID=Q3A154_SYNC1|nr:3-oxoacyl-ACP reductase FabG [Syntrophotalea carbinolica]ABA89903.1 3-oxoacyl-(acyl carrier protein) reductase [Syntrophotalea carbinolica DSM 2380]